MVLGFDRPANSVRRHINMLNAMVNMAASHVFVNQCIFQFACSEVFVCTCKQVVPMT